MLAIILRTTVGNIEVIINRDGTINIEDEAVMYDRAMVEFGEKPSQLLRFIESFEVKFEKHGVMAILEFADIPHRAMVHLAADFVEHVIPCEGFESSHYNFGIMDIINVVRDSMNRELDYQKLLTDMPGDFGRRSGVPRLLEYEDVLFRKLEQLQQPHRYLHQYELLVRHVAYQVYSATISVIEAAHAKIKEKYDVLMFNAQSAAEDSARAARPPGIVIDDEMHRLYLLESSWQLRRLIDCMEAIQAGKDWPDLKDTK